MSVHPELTVFIADHDRAFRESIVHALASTHHGIAQFGTAAQLLAHCAPQHYGCIVADTRLPDMSGGELQTELKRRAIHMPLVFVSAQASVRSAVAALHNGAADFFEKPVSPHALLPAIVRLLRLEAARRREHAKKSTIAAALDRLTSREREIMRCVVAGKMNKTMADELGISVKTVEAHRARVMQKLGVESLAALVQLALDCERPRSEEHTSELQSH